MQLNQDMSAYQAWATSNGGEPPRFFPLGGRAVPGELWQLIDHGFVVGRVCTTDLPELEGVEFAVIGRSYLPAEQIDSPWDGITVVRLPIEAENGVYVLVYPNGPGIHAEQLVGAMVDVGVVDFAYVLPRGIAQRFGILLTGDDGAYSDFQIVPR